MVLPPFTPCHVGGLVLPSSGVLQVWLYIVFLQSPTYYFLVHKNCYAYLVILLHINCTVHCNKFNYWNVWKSFLNVKNLIQNSCCCAQAVSCVSSLRPHGTIAARALYPCGFARQNSGVGCMLSSRIFPAGQTGLQNCRQVYHLSYQGSASEWLNWTEHSG